MTSKQHGFFNHQSYVEKSVWKKREFLTIEINREKYVETTWIF